MEPTTMERGNPSSMQRHIEEVGLRNTPRKGVPRGSSLPEVYHVLLCDMSKTMPKQKYIASVALVAIIVTLHPPDGRRPEDGGLRLSHLVLLK